MLKQIRYEGDIPVRIEILNVKQYPWHIHNDIQIIYIIDGDIELKLTYEKFHLTKDSIHIIHPGDVHGMKGMSEKNLVVVLSLDMKFFLQRYPDLNAQIFTTKTNESLVSYREFLSLKTNIFSIISELYNKEKNYNERIIENACALLDSLYKNFRGFTVDLANRTLEHKVSHDMIQIERIGRVIRHIYDNYAYKLNLNEIADSEGLNPYYLSHLFKQIVGNSFRNFVSTVRVELSEVRLLTTDVPIAQIAADVGFSNAKYYVKNFEQWFGCHPREHRQINREKLLGNAPALCKYVSLEDFNDNISSINTDSHIPVISNHKVVSVNSTRFLNKPLYASFVSSPLEEIYEQYDPIQDCISFLEKWLADPFNGLGAVAMHDTEKRTSGMYTINNLKKPLFWVYTFVCTLPDKVVHYDKDFIITTDQKNLRILIFNKSHRLDKEIEFSIMKKKGDFLATEHRISPSRTCMQLWGQMGFKKEITSKEHRQIEQMSMPQISYKRFSSSGSFTYLCALKPREIVFVEINDAAGI